MRILIFLIAFLTSLSPDEKKFTKIFLPNGNVITVELAVTDEERARGLMFRRKIPENYGMLFIFEREERHGFWMKNTLIYLDMIWLDSKKRIVHIEENVPPCKSEPCEVYYPSKPSLYVLELKGGKAKKEDLKTGDILIFEIH
ncbi:MAG: DUF192 domain-containing protein [Candidatus Aminicenantia bacterium]